MGYDLSKEALMKSRKGVRPARVHTLVNKESAGTGWQSKYKSMSKRGSVEDTRRLDLAIMLKAAGLNLQWFDQQDPTTKTAAIQQMVAKRIISGGNVMRGAPKKVVNPPKPVGSPAKAPMPSFTPQQILGGPGKVQVSGTPVQQPKVPTTASTPKPTPAPTQPALTQQAAPPPPTTPPPKPKQPAQQSKTKQPAQQTAPQQTAPQQTASTPQQPTPQPKQPTPQQPAPQNTNAPTQKTAPPAAPKEAPLPQGYLTPTPELQAAVKSQPGNLATIKQQMSSMPAGQQYEVLSSRSVQLNNMAKSTNPATAAAAKNELAEVNKALKSLSTGQPLTGATSEGWKTFKRYAIPTAIGGGLLYGGSQILNAGTQAYSGPYVPQGY